MTFTHGVGVGWLAPSLPLLGSENTPLDTPVTIDQASWVGSLVGLGALAGNIIFGLVLDRLGRKVCMYFLAIPNMVSTLVLYSRVFHKWLNSIISQTYWILIYTAKDVTYLYAGRFLAGVAGGGCYVVLPIFIAEIADNKWVLCANDRINHLSTYSGLSWV